jgi:D-lactate dehydrogenase (cytochrome)
VDSAIPAEFLNQLKSVVGDAGWRESPADLEPYLTEWRGLYRGATPLLVAPATTAEVAALVRLCAAHGVAIVPQGGNTGLVGGAVPGLDPQRPEILLSLSRLNRVRDIDRDNFTVTVEAGVVLAQLQEAVAAVGLYFPLSLAAEGSCQIGGNISTNAGGTNVLRFGNTRDLVLGLEVVLPDGRLFAGLSGLRKNNTGYALSQLFIGAEGTLGIVTAATLKLFPQPRSTATAWLAVASPAAAVQVYAAARQRIGDELIAFELLPRVALDMVVHTLPGTRDPLPGAGAWYVLLEFAGAREQPELDAQLEAFLTMALADELVDDAVLARNDTQRRDFWRLRHGISEAQKSAGASIKHDIAVPITRLPEFLERADALMHAAMPGVRPVPFGHLGDGNLHYNLSQPVGMAPGEFLARWSELSEQVHSLVAELGGTFSAEHGVGALKRAEMARLKSPVEIELMHQVKHALDPQGIMNPGKVLPGETPDSGAA